MEHAFRDAAKYISSGCSSLTLLAVIPDRQDGLCGSGEANGVEGGRRRAADRHPPSAGCQSKLKFK